MCVCVCVYTLHRRLLTREWQQQHFLLLTFLCLQDYVQAMTGLCYDGLEGFIYLVLFSFITALMFSSIVCSVPHTWQARR